MPARHVDALLSFIFAPLAVDVSAAAPTTHTQPLEECPRPPFTDALQGTCTAQPLRLFLGGYHRRPCAVPVEPTDVWVSVLSDSVPFFQDCHIVFPSTVPEDVFAAAQHRAQEVFPRATIYRLAERQHDSSLHRADAAKGTAVVPAAASSKTPKFQPLLELVPPHSLDLVIYAGNVFADEMLSDAPWFASVAHRSLRSHGVLAIIGHASHGHVDEPQWAGRDVKDYISSFRSDLEGILQNDSPGAKSSKLKEKKKLLVEQLRRAHDGECSADVGHADIYLPFPAVKRRWYRSMHRVLPGEVAALLRSRQTYKCLQQLERVRAMDVPCEGTTGATDFVDTPLPTGLLREEPEREALGVQHREWAMDPLEGLEHCLTANLLRTSTDQGRATSTDLHPIQLELQHFTITCSYRGMNRIS